MIFLETPNAYKVQAEKIAVEAFLNFDDISKARFFAFLQEVLAEKKDLYQFFYTQYADLRVGKQILSKPQQSELLAVILPFLSREHQFYLLQCEALQKLQVQKDYLTYRGKYTLSFKELVHILVVYHDHVQHLHEGESVWFDKKSCHTSDRQEALQAIRYVLLCQLNAHKKALQQDLQIIVAHKKDLPAQTQYFFDFLGVKVLLDSEKIDPQAIEVFADAEMPRPQTSFRTVLEKYLLEELTAIDELTKQQQAQSTLFIYDLPTTLAHYQKTHLPARQIKAQATFAAGAGKFSVQMRTQKHLEKAIYAMLFSVGAIGFFAFGISVKGLITLSIGVAMWLIIKLFRVGKQEVNKNQEERKKKKELTQIYTEKYREIIDLKKQELNYIFVREEILDKIKDAIYWKIKHKKISIYAKDVYLNPLYMLRLYQKYADFIKKIKMQDIDILYAIGGDDTQKMRCLDMMKYLFMKKLEQSYRSFLNLANLMIHHKLRFSYYMYFLEVACEIPKSDITVTSFYDYNEGMELYEYQTLAERIEAKKEFIYPYPNEVAQDPTMQTWLWEELQKMPKDSFETEYATLDSFLKQKKKLFLIEGEEGVLLYAAHQ